MDSKNRSDSDERLKDEAIARRLGNLLDRMPAKSESACPDAEILAAYYERSLQPDEIAQWEGHFASCARCRKSLAAIAAAVEAPILAGEATSSTGDATTAAVAGSATRTTKPAPPRRFDWRVRWLAPALGMAAVLVVWFAMRPPLGTLKTNSPQTYIAQAPKSDLQPIPGQAVPDVSLTTPDLKSQKDSVPGHRARENSPARPQAKISRAPNDVNATGAKKQEPAPLNEVAQNGSGGDISRGIPSPSPQAPPAAPVPSRQAPTAGATAGGVAALGSTSQTVVVTEEAPLVTTKSVTPQAGAAADQVSRDDKTTAPEGAAGNQAAARSPAIAPLNGRNFPALSLQKAPGKMDVQLKPPTGTVFWRAGAGGIIERSADAGSTWVGQTSPSQQDWLAGAAVSDRVGWLVGRKAAIARTTDGVTWNTVTPPPLATIAAGVPPDWIAVTATDAQTATITSTDQHQYVTQDGGKTWRAQ
jgi:hypothetical protein